MRLRKRTTETHLLFRGGTYIITEYVQPKKTESCMIKVSDDVRRVNDGEILIFLMCDAIMKVRKPNKEYSNTPSMPVLGVFSTTLPLVVQPIVEQ